MSSLYLPFACWLCPQKFRTNRDRKNHLISRPHNRMRDVWITNRPRAELEPDYDESVEEKQPSKRTREYSPSKPDVGKPCVIQSISLEGGVIRVYAKSEEEIFTVILSVEAGPTPQILPSLMRRSQVIKRDSSFQIPSRSTPVSSTSSVGVMHGSLGLTVRWLRRFPKAHPRLLFSLLSLNQFPLHQEPFSPLIPMICLLPCQRCPSL